MGYVVVNFDTICAMIPEDENHMGDLGYYKFVLIDVSTDTIIKECPINVFE